MPTRPAFPATASLSPTAPRWRRSTGSRKRTRRSRPPTVPGTLHDVDFMVKDSKRFADSGGWGYAAFNYDAASDTFAPATRLTTAAGERRQVRVRVPHDSEGEGLRVHGVREAVNRAHQGEQRAPLDYLFFVFLFGAGNAAAVSRMSSARRSWSSRSSAPTRIEAFAPGISEALRVAFADQRLPWRCDLHEQLVVAHQRDDLLATVERVLPEHLARADPRHRAQLVEEEINRAL